MLIKAQNEGACHLLTLRDASLGRALQVVRHRGRGMAIRLRCGSLSYGVMLVWHDTQWCKPGKGQLEDGRRQRPHGAVSIYCPTRGSQHFTAQPPSNVGVPGRRRPSCREGSSPFIPGTRLTEAPMSPQVKSYWSSEGLTRGRNSPPAQTLGVSSEEAISSHYGLHQEQKGCLQSGGCLQTPPEKSMCSIGNYLVNSHQATCFLLSSTAVVTKVNKNITKVITEIPVGPFPDRGCILRYNVNFL